MKDSDRKKLEEIADDMMDSVLVFSRRVSREGSHHSGWKFDPSRLVLKKVQEMGTVPMSRIGSHMEISKPYMTALVDKLIAEGLVERIADPDDRRIIRIRITHAGKEVLREFNRLARESIVRRLSSLDVDDISALHESTRKTRNILSKLDQERT